MKRFQQHRHALGSEVYITLVDTDERKVGRVFEDVWQAIGLFEHTFSRFMQDSELTYVNERAGVPTPVSREFMRLAETAKDYASATDGLYNPFVLPNLQKAGYKGSWPAPDVQGEAPDYTARELAQWDALTINGSTVTLPPGSALDFGGIGKGYALDELARMLEHEGVEHYWLSLGGDILTGGNDIDGKPWTIEIASAANENEVAAHFEIRQQTVRAVATSGTLKRAGEGWNRLIDPRTGQSTTSDIVMATVAAENGTSADVYAKCLVLVGSEHAEQFAAGLGVSTYLLHVRETDGTMRILKKGLFT